jgi:beta-mannanase
MKKVFLLLLLVTMSGLAVNSRAQEFSGQATPANPNANPTARAILDYLYQLPSQSQNRVISGQFGSYGDGTSYATAANQLQAIFNKTGQWPGLTGMDCATPAGMSEVVRYLTDKWNEGYLVNLSCHFRNPWTGGPSTDTGASSSDPYGRRSVRELITPGAPGNAAWMSTLDNLAGHLQTLQSRGVVVFFRPLHENNGSWFWWGYQNPADFIALWRHMFDYFTRVKGLNNLLWVYSPNTADQWRAENTRTNYPGNDFVDLVSLDAYMSLNSTTLQLNSQGEYDFLTGTGKPFGLFEWGAIPASGAGWDINPYPYRMDHLIRDIKARYPRMVLFQAWEYVWQLGRDQFRGLPELMNDPWVIARHELPNFRGGVVAPTTVPPTTVPPTTVPPTTIPPTTIPSTPAPNGNIISNGTFAAGMANWWTYGQVTSRVTNGMLEFHRPTGSPQAVVLQNTGRSFAANVGLEARFDLGNVSGIRKRVSVLLHDGDFSDLQVCSFWLPPNVPLRTYTMRGATSKNWSQAFLAIYASTADSQGWIRVDNVSLSQQPAASATETICIDPLATAPIGGADGPNMIRNGNFGSSQLAPWYQYGQVTASTANGVLSFYRTPGDPAGVVGQATNMTVAPNMPLEARFDLGNTSNVRKRVTVLMHDNDFSDVLVCAFWLPPNMPMGRFIMRARTTKSWSNAAIAFYPTPADSLGWIRVDNVSMITRPSLSVNGTNCYEPGSSVSGESMVDEVMEVELIPPTLEPTATPYLEGLAEPGLSELPVIATALPTVSPLDLPPEGVYSEQPVAEPGMGGEIPVMPTTVIDVPATPVPPIDGEVPITPPPAEGELPVTPPLAEGELPVLPAPTLEGELPVTPPPETGG